MTQIFLWMQFSYIQTAVHLCTLLYSVQRDLKGWERLLREISGAGWLQKVSGPRRSDHCATIVQRPMSNCPSSYLWSHVWPDFHGWHQNWWKIKKILWLHSISHCVFCVRVGISDSLCCEWRDPPQSKWSKHAAMFSFSSSAVRDTSDQCRSILVSDWPKL